MGDGVLVYFGYPQAHEDDAERAVRAGLGLIQTVSGLQSSAPLQTRVGIATGLVVVGELIGSGSAQEQTVVGETPNLAARLQGIAEPNTVVIAESTRKLLGNLFDLEDLGGKDLKGVFGPVRAWAALRPSSVESRFEALRTATTPLVGREEELDLLLRRWEQIKRNDGSVVLISGEPGIGKSRIVQTIVERLSGELHTRLRFFCSPHHQDSALYPSIAQLERAAGFRREDLPERRLEKLEAVLAQGTDDLGQVVPLLAGLLSVPTGHRYPPLDLTPQKRKEKTLQAQVAQIEGLAAREPVLMVWEDVHWSDPTTRESLDLLIDRVPKLRVLMILTFRPEFTPPWIGRPHVTILTLNRLPRGQVTELIGYLTGGKALPNEISHQIVNRTDGIPLFIEELTKTVVESGIVTEADDHYTLTGPMLPMSIPTSLHASLLARLDSLAPTREAVQIGAALGRSFSYELISAVAEMPKQKLDEALDQLASAELIFRRGLPPDAEYTFKHALVQDAAYSTLLRTKRQQLHARIAGVLERKFPEVATSTPEVLARHYTDAGNAAQGVPYWLKAGEAALQRSALAEAGVHLKNGLSLVKEIKDEKVSAGLELRLQVTLALALSGSKGLGVPEVEQAYLRARALCDQIGATPQLFPVLYGLFIFRWVRGQLQMAHSIAEEMLSIAVKADDTVLLLIAHFSLGGVLYHIGDYRAALDHLQQARARYDEREHADLAFAYGVDFGVWTLNYLGVTHLVLGFPDKGSQASQEASTLARRLNHPLSLSNALIFNAMCCIHRRDWASARGFAEAAGKLAGEHGFLHYLAITTAQIAWTLPHLGSVNEGIEMGRQGISACMQTGMNITMPFGFAHQSEAFLAGQQSDAALRSADEALAWSERNGEHAYDCLVRCCRGDVFRELNDPERARQEYEGAIAIAQKQETKFWELRAAMSLARLWRDQGKGDEARELLAPVYGWFTEGFDTRDLKEAKALLDELSS